VLATGAQRVGDLVQHGVAHLIDTVQQHERPRQADATPRIVARPETPPRVIETERPVDQAMLLHKRPRQVCRFV